MIQVAVFIAPRLEYTFPKISPGDSIILRNLAYSRLCSRNRSHSFDKLQSGRIYHSKGIILFPHFCQRLTLIFCLTTNAR